MDRQIEKNRDRGANRHATYKNIERRGIEKSQTIGHAAISQSKSVYSATSRDDFENIQDPFKKRDKIPQTRSKKSPLNQIAASKVERSSRQEYNRNTSSSASTKLGGVDTDGDAGSVWNENLPEVGSSHITGNARGMRKKKASRKADITKKLNILGPEEFVHTRTLLENPLTITRVDPDTFQQYKNTIAFYSESHNEEHRTFYRARVPNYIPTYYISEPNGAKFPEDNTWTNHNTPYSNGLQCESGNVAPINYTRLNSPSSIDGPLQKPKRTDSKLGSCNCIIL